jgi:hypothetical protein
MIYNFLAVVFPYGSKLSLEPLVENILGYDTSGRIFMFNIYFLNSP